ncbi:MAG TPA: MBL fold metallo-hydrolase [Chryseolinea sp.]
MLDTVIEIIVLGGVNAYGESIIVHDGKNNWFIIDSFVSDKVPAPLHYLQSRGVNLQHVKRVVATHWHNDHIRGLDEVVKQCTEAEFFCSQACNSKEFEAVLKATNASRAIDTTSVMSSILTTLKGRDKHYAGALAGVLLFSDANPFLSQLIALSPSQKTCDNSRAEYSKKEQNALFGNYAVASPTPNDKSVVLFFEINGQKIVLGADLEVSNGVDAAFKGWAAVCSHALCPTGISVFKAAHHGSRNGRSHDFWTRNLSPTAKIGLTCFNRGQDPPPSAADIQEILAYGLKAYITARPGREVFQYDEETQGLLDIFDISITNDTPSAYGTIHFSLVDGENQWKVGLHGTAYELAPA